MRKDTRRNKRGITRKRKASRKRKRIKGGSATPPNGEPKVVHFHNNGHYGDHIFNLKFFLVNTKILKERGIQIHYYYDDGYIKDRSELEAYVDPEVVHLHPIAEKPESAIEIYIGNKIGDLTHRKFKTFMIEFYKQIVKHLGLEDLNIDLSLFQKEDYLLDIYAKLGPKFHDVDVLILNSPPASRQFPGYDQAKFDALATRLSKRFKVAVISAVNDIPCTRTDGLKLRDVGAVSTHAKFIIGMNSGPIVPCLNIYAKNSVKKWILFDKWFEEMFGEVETNISLNINATNEKIP
jgi:hypothetical protein